MKKTKIIRAEFSNPLYNIKDGEIGICPVCNKAKMLKTQYLDLYMCPNCKHTTYQIYEGGILNKNI